MPELVCTSILSELCAGTCVGAIASRWKAFQNPSPSPFQASSTMMSCTFAPSPVEVASVSRDAITVCPGSTAVPGRTVLSSVTAMSGLTITSGASSVSRPFWPLGAVTSAVTVLVKGSSAAPPVAASVVTIVNGTSVCASGSIVLPV